MIYIAVAIILSGVIIAANIPTRYEYKTELKNLTYQLSRIADALISMVQEGR